MWNYAWEVCWSCVFFPLGIKSDNFDDSKKQKLHTSGRGVFVRSLFIPYHMHIPSTLILLHFLCVYLPFRFHSHLLPCLGINNITICCNKIQVTCFIIIIISYLWFFWRWCTNDGDYNSNTYIIIVHDLIRHLSLLFSPNSHEVSHMWLDDCSFSFRIETKADLNFIKSKRKFIWNFCMKKGFFNLRCVVFLFRSCLQGTMLTSKPQFNRKHNGEN
jgi:hypothetical protein